MRVVALMLVTLVAAVPRAGGGGVTVSVAPGWHALPAPWLGDGAVTDPVTRVVLASAPIHWKDTGCQIASYAFSRRAVAIVIVEWRKRWPGTRFPPRPRRFTARNLPVLTGRPVFECFDGGGGSIQFADHGRTFQANILLGRDASPRLARNARRVLDTLRVSPR